MLWTHRPAAPAVSRQVDIAKAMPALGVLGPKHLACALLRQLLLKLLENPQAMTGVIIAEFTGLLYPCQRRKQLIFHCYYWLNRGRLSLDSTLGDFPCLHLRTR